MKSTTKRPRRQSGRPATKNRSKLLASQQADNRAKTDAFSRHEGKGNGQPPRARQAAKLERTTFCTSRLADFCSEKNLVAQTGHDSDEWPLVVGKELVDNNLDACEENGVPPKVKIVVDARGITVSDNGAGMLANTIERILDYSVKVSSREAYVAPDRGAQGNALQTIFAMPFVLDGKVGRVNVSSRGQQHEIRFTVDQVRREPVISHTSRPARNVQNVQSGTITTVFWASSLRDMRRQFVQLGEDFGFLNPHLSLSTVWFGRREGKSEATTTDWQKWTPNRPTSAHWYRVPDFERLVAAYISHDREHGIDRSVREFIREFNGPARTAKQRAILEATGLARTNLSSLVNCDGLRHDVTSSLLDAMKANSKPVKPAALGVIGKNHIERRFADFGAEMETFCYRKVTGTDGAGLPYVVEAAFAWRGEDSDDERRLITGINWSPALISPFRELGDDSLDGVLWEQKAGPYEPVVLLVHLATPRARYTDRGKSAVVVDDHKAEAIVRAVKHVTSRWAKQRKAEERETSRIANRRAALIRSKKMSVKDAAWEVMEEAYLKASTEGTLPAKTRQIYYAARRKILAMTGKEKLNQGYFSQTLVPAYMEEHPEETADWDVVYDARGKLTEPHTKRTVLLGTIEVRRYLDQVRSHSVPTGAIPIDLPIMFPTCGPDHRFGAIMFVEKEGFDELFKAVRLADRYDIAIMSTKGMSVTACRQLADVLCGEHGIPLLVAHDLDKAGLSMLGTFQRDSHRYKFRHDFPVVDLGLRLDDVRDWGLESEYVAYGLSKNGKPRDPRPNLRINGATDEEIEFLSGDFSWTTGYSGQRVELNGFTSGDLVKWFEGKFHKHGIKKVVPDNAVLESAYRRALQIEIVRSRLDAIVQEAADQAQQATLPRHLDRLVRKGLKVNPAQAWDHIIAATAAAKRPGGGTKSRGRRP